MRIIHLFNDSNKKFYKPFISFINENFNFQNHRFIIISDHDNTSENFQTNNIVYIFKMNYFKLVKEFYTADKIILHSLFSTKILLVLFFNPILLKKCYWTVWGSDLYYYLFRKRNFKSNINEFFRRHIIRHLGGIITQVRGDYELAKKWYRTTGNYYYCFMYPSNIYTHHNFIKKNLNHSTYIQVGNSADPTNKHIEVLEKLKLYKDKDIKIICPLSYGNVVYANKVICFGEKLYGEKFIPLTDFLDINEYNELLSNINIAIFNHERQQALGNIITLIGLGKKVYIREEITTWQFCLDHGLKVYSANKEYEDFLEDIDEKTKFANKNTVEVKFSLEKLKEDWSKIFNGENV